MWRRSQIHGFIMMSLHINSTVLTLDFHMYVWIGYVVYEKYKKLTNAAHHMTN